LDLQAQLDKIYNQINTIKDATDHNIESINKEIDRLLPIDEFDDYIRKFITIGDLLEAGKEKEADEEIEKLTEEFQEALKRLDNPIYKSFLEALLKGSEKGESEK